MNMAKLPRMAFRNDPQLPFLERPEVKSAVAGMAIAGAKSRGAVFTRREVVDFILDLADYFLVDKPLHHARLLKPWMGQGDFLTPAIDRLFEVYAREVGKRGDIVKDLGDCITAVELHHASYEHARQTGHGYAGHQRRTGSESQGALRTLAEAGRFPVAAA